jgi:hypothetical protein
MNLKFTPDKFQKTWETGWTLDETLLRSMTADALYVWSSQKS